MIYRAALNLRYPLTNTPLNNLLTLIRFSSSSLAAASYPGNQTTNGVSADESDGGGSAVYHDARKYARPSTVTWSERLHNSVSLIGTVEYPLKQYATKNGRIGGHTMLRVKTSPDSHNCFRTQGGCRIVKRPHQWRWEVYLGDDEIMWICLEMWDELAERALLHLKPNDYIYISGELGSYTKTALEGIERRRYKVKAKELNYVNQSEHENNFRVMKSGPEVGESSLHKYRSRLHLWQVFFASPNEWYDQRKCKKSPKQPDFKHKSTGEVLWLNADDPPWVKKQVGLLDSTLSRGVGNDMSLKFLASRWVSDEQLDVLNLSKAK